MHALNAVVLLAAGVAAGRVPLVPSSVTTTSTSAAAGRQAIVPKTTTTAGRAPIVPVTTVSKSSSSSTSSTTKSTTSTTTTTSIKPTTTSTSTTPPPVVPVTPTSTLVTSTTSSAPACTSTLTGYGCLPLTNQAAFVTAMLNQHNTYRARHNAPAMTWNPDLVPAALANAQNNANNNVFVHTSNDQYGENIAYQYGYNNPEYLGYLWYDEVEQYNFYDPGFSDATGHFTQMVWTDSTELGCAYVQASNSLSNNGYYYLSCEYSPPGNYAGEYAQKVLAPNSNPFPTQPPQFI